MITATGVIASLEVVEEQRNLVRVVIECTRDEGRNWAALFGALVVVTQSSPLPGREPTGEVAP